MNPDEVYTKYKDLTKPIMTKLGHVILPKGTVVKCPQCKHEDTITQLTVRKKLTCSNCTNTKVLIDDESIDNVELDLSEDEPEPEKKEEDGSYNIIDKSKEPTDKQKKKLFEQYRRKPYLKMNERIKVIDWLKKFNLIEEAEKYCEDYVKPNDGKDDKDDYEALKKRDLETIEKVKRDSLKEDLTKKTEVALEKQKEKNNAMVKKFEDSGGVDYFVKIILDIHDRAFKKFERAKLTQDEKDNLSWTWKGVIEMYLPDVDDWIKYFPLILLFYFETMIILDRISPEKKTKEEVKKKMPLGKLKEEDKTKTKIDYSTFSYAVIKAIAKEKGIKIYRQSKLDLIKEIEKIDSDNKK